MGMIPTRRDDDGGISLEEENQTRFKKPSMWAVVLLNDDYTPMDFVVGVLMEVFGKTGDEAMAITMQGHKNGKALAGIFTKEIAEMKVNKTHNKARASQYPLRCDLEEQGN